MVAQVLAAPAQGVQAARAPPLLVAKRHVFRVGRPRDDNLLFVASRAGATSARKEPLVGDPRLSLGTMILVIVCGHSGDWIE
jgi:hypothetical protein